MQLQIELYFQFVWKAPAFTYVAYVAFAVIGKISYIIYAFKRKKCSKTTQF